MASLTISILADVSKASKALQEIQGQTEGFADKAKGALAGLAGAFSLNKLQGWASEWTGLAREAAGSADAVTRVFGEAAGSVFDWAKENANAIGLTAAEAGRYAVVLGNQLQSYGVTAEDAASQSTEALRRSADVAKVLGKDMESVQGAISSALKGRFNSMKDLGVQMDKETVQARLLGAGLGELTEDELTAAQASEVLAMFLEQTGHMAGSVKPGNLKELGAAVTEVKTSLGEGLQPIIKEIIPYFLKMTDWAKENPALLRGVVYSLMAVAAALSLASIAMGIFALVSSPIALIVGGIVLALAGIAAVVYLVVTNFDTLTGALRGALDWILNLTSGWGDLLLLFGGPLGLAILAVKNFEKAWEAVKRIVAEVADRIGDLIGKAGGILGRIPGVPWAAGGGGGFGPASSSSSVTLAPAITFNGDVGDPSLIAGRVIGALEVWTAANGRARIARLAGLG